MDADYWNLVLLLGIVSWSFIPLCFMYLPGFYWSKFRVQVNERNKVMNIPVCFYSGIFLVTYFVLVCIPSVRRKTPGNFICLGIFVSSQSKFHPLSLLLNKRLQEISIINMKWYIFRLLHCHGWWEQSVGKLSCKNSPSVD